MSYPSCKHGHSDENCPCPQCELENQVEFALENKRVWQEQARLLSSQLRLCEEHAGTMAKDFDTGLLVVQKERDSLRAQLLQCQAACAKIREVADVVEIYRSINESVGTERMWSEFQDALSTSPATALAEALESALKEGFEIKDRIWPSNSHNAWIASDTRKKLP